MNLGRTVVLAGALMLSTVPALADKIIQYTLDPWHTQVRFTWEHAGFSTPGAAFTDVTGTIQGDQDVPEKSTVDVVIPVKSLDSYVPALNEHLLDSGDFFKAKQYPEITFKSTEITDVNRTARTFKLHGVLTVNGISKPVVLDAKANKVGGHPFYNGAPAAGFDASTMLKRTDFGMGAYVPLVSDELKVVITVEAIETAAYQKKMEEITKKAAH